MTLSVEEEKGMPPAKRAAVLRAEIEARLAALEGGEPSDRHLANIKWLRAEIWELEEIAKIERKNK